MTEPEPSKARLRVRWSEPFKVRSLWLPADISGWHVTKCPSRASQGSRRRGRRGASGGRAEVLSPASSIKKSASSRRFSVVRFRQNSRVINLGTTPAFEQDARSLSVPRGSRNRPSSSARLAALITPAPIALTRLDIRCPQPPASGSRRSAAMLPSQERPSASAAVVP
jgi:hypothetical protein